MSAATERRRSASPTSITALLNQKMLFSKALSYSSTDYLDDNLLTLAVTTRDHSTVSSCKYSEDASNSVVRSSWTAELAHLKQAGSILEAAICLRRIRDELETMSTHERVKYCQTDFESAISRLKRQRFMTQNDLSYEMTSLTIDFFNKSLFQLMPTDVIKEIFMWLPIDDFSPVPTVCKDWKELASSDEVWQTFYRYKFLRRNPDSMPIETVGYLQAFKDRLADPQLGDKVEVAWRGKFRLEALDVYQGLAWWVAEIVDKHTSQGKYKIRYPGWESRWDEWVPKSRLRWAVDKNEITHITPNDVVELWCCGANVPGAWLESRVKKVRNGRYCVGRVLSTGSLWVERDRLRLVKHVINIEGESMSPAMTDPRVQLTTHASVVSMDNGRRGILDRFRRRSNITGGCCTM